MANPTSLFTLASGRLTPLSRAALAGGLGLFAAIIFLIRPVHLAHSPLVKARASVLALEQASPWADRAVLQDGASLFMSGNSEDVRTDEAAQPDASPFPPFGPELRHDPAMALAISTSDSTIRWAGLDEVFPLREERPYQTLGQRPAKPLLSPRCLRIEVFSDNNENVFQKDFPSSDPLLKGTKLFNSINLKDYTVVEFRLGIDAMGLQSKPYLQRGSSQLGWNQELSHWMQGLPWGIWLKPGSYRVVIGP